MFSNISYNHFSNTIHLYEIDENGNKTHIIEDYQHPYYVECAESESDCYSLLGKPMKKLIAKNKKEYIKNTKIMGENISICEGDDIKETIKYLHNRYENTNMNVNYNFLNVLFYDIEIEIEEEFPESDLAQYPVNAITLYFSKSQKVYVLLYSSTQKYTGSMDITKLKEHTKSKKKHTAIQISDLVFIEYEDEKQLFDSFIKIFKKEKPDVITGWNTDEFDNKYIINRMYNLGIAEKKINSLSPTNKISKNEKTGIYRIEGISSLDYMRLYKKFNAHSQNTSLNNACKKELSKHKLEFEGTLQQLYRDDWNLFVEYNMIDTMRVVEIEEELGMINTVYAMCHDSLVPPEDIFGTISDHLGMVLNFVHRDNMVLPNRIKKIENETEEEMSMPGGMVFAEKGRRKYAISRDASSLYPNIAIKFNIGPDTIVQCDDDDLEDYIVVVKNDKQLHLKFNTNINIKRNSELLTIKVQDLCESDSIIF